MNKPPVLPDEFPDADTLLLTQLAAPRPGLHAHHRQTVLAACVVSLRQLTPSQPLSLAFQQHLLDIALEYEAKYHALLAAEERRRDKASAASARWQASHKTPVT